MKETTYTGPGSYPKIWDVPTDAEEAAWLRQQIKQELDWLRENKGRFAADLYRETEGRWSMLATKADQWPESR